MNLRSENNRENNYQRMYLRKYQKKTNAGWKSQSPPQESYIFPAELLLITKIFLIKLILIHLLIKVQMKRNELNTAALFNKT